MNGLVAAVSVLAVCLFSKLSYAQTFTANGIGVTDSDAIAVLQGNQQVKVRLNGVESPEFSDRIRDCGPIKLFPPWTRTYLCRVLRLGAN